MRKKLTLLLIAAMTAGLLYACTPAATTPPPSAPPAETPTTAPTAKPTAAPTAPPANLAAPSLQRNRPDEYAYMWFRNGTTGSGSKELYVKTGRYGFGFDPDAFSFTKLGLSAPDASYDGDLTAAGDAVAAMAGASSALTIFRNGAAHSALRTTDDYNGGYRNLSIITMGQVCQSFYVNNIPYDGLDSLNARVEINAFCDYFTVYWDVVSRTELTDLRCEYEFNTGDASLTEAKWYDDDPASGILSLSNADGSRVITFVSPLFDKNAARHTLTLVSPGVVKVTSESFTSPARTGATSFARKRTYGVGLIVIPGEADLTQAVRFVRPDSVELTAAAFAPYSKSFSPSYDGLTGTYCIQLRSNGFKADVLSIMLERVSLKAVNKLGAAQRINLMLTHKDGTSVAVVGSVPMLRDVDGVPTGVPVQVSKDWHTSETPKLYDGSWQEFYLKLALPADPTPVENEFTVAYQTWGGVPAASHAQLCLIGWSSEQALQWEEAAVAAYTECICYAPDLFGESFVNDVRGILLTKKGSLKNLGGFSDNVGGADFMVYRVNDGRTRIFPKDMKTEYVAHGPNLATVRYSGVSSDDAVAFTYTVRIQRSGDLARIYHSFDYRFLKDVSASTFSVYSYGAEHYNESGFASFAYGNADGVTREYNVFDLRQGSADTYDMVYVSDPVPMTGENPWMSWTGTRSEVIAGFGHYDRALVVRDWDAVVGGRPVETPYLHIRVANAHQQGRKLPTNIMELTAGVDSFSAGDRIRGTVEIMVLPQAGNEYVGTDAQFAAAAQQYAGSWELARYEANGNAVTVTDIAGASLVSLAPAVLRGDDGAGEISFTLRNGVSYVPVTFTNLGTNRDWLLQEYVGEKWLSISNSQEIHGNDYWQCRYDAVSGTYELTYNVYRDSSVSSSAQFRLIQKGALN